MLLLTAFRHQVFSDFWAILVWICSVVSNFWILVVSTIFYVVIERSVSSRNRTHVLTKEGYWYPVCLLSIRSQRPISRTGRFTYIRYPRSHSVQTPQSQILILQFCIKKCFVNEQNFSERQKDLINSQLHKKSIS